MSQPSGSPGCERRRRIMSRWCSASIWQAVMEASQDDLNVSMIPRSSMRLFFVNWESRSRRTARVRQVKHSTHELHREAADVHGRDGAIAFFRPPFEQAGSAHLNALFDAPRHLAVSLGSPRCAK